MQGLWRGSSAPSGILAHYRVHYADGTEVAVPVVRPVDVADTVVEGNQNLAAWRGWTATDSFTRLYHQVWDNPRPGVAVTHLDVEATNSGSALFFTAALTVETSPPVRIRKQPEPQRVSLGGLAEFRGEVDSTVPVVYQWQRDGQDLPGATNEVLRLGSVSRDQVGSYSVRVSVAGSEEAAFAQSEAVPLEVEEGPWLLGALRMEFYRGVPTKYLSNLVAHARFPGQPDRVQAINRFEAPWEQGEDFGLRVSGYLQPPATGDYRFYVASDDQCQVFLSPGEDPDQKELIAQETHWQPPCAWVATRRRVGTANVSRPIRLEAGHRYYVEGWMKEGAVLDHFAVTWQRPGEPPPRNGDPPILGRYLQIPAAWVQLPRP